MTDAASSRAAARPVPLGSGPGRRRTDSRVEQLQRLSARLDELLSAEVNAPTASHGSFERRCAEGEAIGTGIIAAYRGITSPQPSAAPLWQQGGKAIW